MNKSAAILALLLFQLTSIAADLGCPPGTVYVPDDNGLGNKWKCFLFATYPQQYLTAERACMNNNGHLTSIHNQFMNNLLAQAATDAFGINDPNVKFYVGANNLGGTGWQNIEDASTAEFTNWAPNEPNSTLLNVCVFVDLYGLWYNGNCYDKYPYICEVPQIGSTTKVTFFPTSPQPLTLPTPTPSTSTLPSVGPTTKATTHASTNTHHPKHDSNATVTPNPVSHSPIQISTESPSTVPPPTVPSTPESEGSSTPPPISSFFSCPNSNFSFDADTQTCYIALKTVKSTWNDSQAICRAFNGSLAFIDDQVTSLMYGVALQNASAHLKESGSTAWFYRTCDSLSSSGACWCADRECKYVNRDGPAVETPAHDCGAHCCMSMSASVPSSAAPAMRTSVQYHKCDETMDYTLCQYPAAITGQSKTLRTRARRLRR